VMVGCDSDGCGNIRSRLQKMLGSKSEKKRGRVVLIYILFLFYSFSVGVGKEIDTKVTFPLLFFFLTFVLAGVWCSLLYSLGT
jgi:hypothetical protein